MLTEADDVEIHALAGRGVRSYVTFVQLRELGCDRAAPHAAPGAGVTVEFAHEPGEQLERRDAELPGTL